MVDVVFEDKQYLSLVETNRAAETRLGEPLIKALRKRLIFLRSAPDERSLRNWKSLHYEKNVAGTDWSRSVRLNDQFRLLFEIDNARMPPRITITGVADYH